MTDRSSDRRNDARASPSDGDHATNSQILFGSYCGGARSEGLSDANENSASNSERVRIRVCPRSIVGENPASSLEASSSSSSSSSESTLSADGSLRGGW